MPQRISLTCGRGERDTSYVGRFPPARTIHNKNKLFESDADNAARHDQPPNES